MLEKYPILNLFSPEEKQYDKLDFSPNYSGSVYEVDSKPYELSDQSKQGGGNELRRKIKLMLDRNRNEARRALKQRGNPKQPKDKIKPVRFRDPLQEIKKMKTNFYAPEHGNKPFAPDDEQVGVSDLPEETSSGSSEETASSNNEPPGKRLTPFQRKVQELPVPPPPLIK